MLSLTVKVFRQLRRLLEIKNATYLEKLAIKLHVFPILYGLGYVVREINDFCHNDLMVRPKGPNSQPNRYRSIQVKSCYRRQTYKNLACFYNINQYGAGRFPKGQQKHETLLFLVCVSTSEVWCVPGSVLQSNKSGKIKIGVKSKLYDRYKVHPPIPPKYTSYLKHKVYRPHLSLTQLLVDTKKLFAKHKDFKTHWKQYVQGSNTLSLMRAPSDIHYDCEQYWNSEGLCEAHALEHKARTLFNRLHPCMKLYPVNGSLTYDSLLWHQHTQKRSRVQEKICYQRNNGFGCKFSKKLAGRQSAYTLQDFDYLLAYLMGGWDEKKQWIANARQVLVGFWLIPIHKIIQESNNKKYLTLYARQSFYDGACQQHGVAHKRSNWSSAYFVSLTASVK